MGPSEMRVFIGNTKIPYANFVDIGSQSVITIVIFTSFSKG